MLKVPALKMCTRNTGFPKPHLKQSIERNQILRMKLINDKKPFLGSKYLGDLNYLLLSSSY